MTQLKNTPGPWYIDKNGDIKTVDREITVAQISWMRNEGEDANNAHLIAAAPELLEALQAMLEVHGVTQAYAEKHIEIPQCWVEVSDLARAAIAKATGQS